MKTVKILLVEDDRFLRELYSDVLTNEGYKVDQAADGEEGLKKIKGGGYDIVLLDILMTKINGLEIMKKIKSHPPKNPNKFTIFFTNLDDRSQIKEALKFADGYLIKSQITPDKLIGKIKSLLPSS